MTKTTQSYKSDVIIIGGGLAGIVTAFELLDRGQQVMILERDSEEKFGGLAKESFGGVTMVGTPHQKKLGIKDTPELALSDWHSFAEFGPDDVWPRRWVETYVNRSIELIYLWLKDKKIKFLPLVNWAERGLFQPGNSLPRFHIAWGTGYGIIESILNELERHPNRSRLKRYFNHRVERLETSQGTVSGCSGIHEKTGEAFEAAGQAVVVATGGMCGGDLSKLRKNWYGAWGDPPDTLLNGSHRFADGMLHDQVSGIGGRVTHLDKHWHYAAGIHHPKPDKEMHGLSLVPPRSALWLNAHGKRIGPVPLMGYMDTRYLVEQICRQPGQYSWQVLNWKIAIKELAVSGCDYMHAFRHKKKLRLILDILFGNKALINTLINTSANFVTARSMGELAEKMNGSGGPFKVDADLMTKEIQSYDAQIDRGPKFFNDDQLRRIANFRTYKGDRLRTCRFQKIDDPNALPLIAIKEFILSRKSLGGIQTDLECRVLNQQGEPITGLYAVGESAGFGGGGIHGLRALEGTFLGACVLTGRLAGMAIDQQL